MTAMSVLTADIAVLVVIGPVATIGASTRRAATLAAIGALVWLAASGASLTTVGVDGASVLVAHVVLATVAMATAGIGRALRAMFDNSLDAIAAALCVSWGASFGIFAIGRFAGELSPGVLNMLLAANPLVAAASAARIDIFHSPLLYRASPIAHQLFEYPPWQVSSALFVGTAAAGAAFAGWSTRRKPVGQA